MPDRRHGHDTLGLRDVLEVPSSEGHFGRIFHRLSALELYDGMLLALARAVRVEAGISTDNPTIPAGYTYVGQLIDHDLIFDVASAQQRILDPSGRLDFRTLRLNLDHVYGSRPVDEPFQRDQNAAGGGKFLPGSNGISLDLPRNT